MKRTTLWTAFVLLTTCVAAATLSASAEARGFGGGGGGLGGKKVGGKGGRRSGAQAQTLIDNAVRRDNVRRARLALL